MNNTINGFVYFDAPDNGMGCNGCVAQDNSPLCAKLQQTGGSYNHCSDHDVIWLLPNSNKVELETTQGTFQQAQATVLCDGCVAERDRALCREIIQLTGCKDYTKIWIKSQPVAPNIPEVLSILQEECAEVIQAVSKVQRFGLLAHHPHRTATNKEELEEELGDLLAMINILTWHGYLDQANIQLASQAKADKLKQYSTVWTSKPTN